MHNIHLLQKMASKKKMLFILEELGQKSKKKQKKNLKEIKELALKDGITDFRSSDMSYYSEKLKKLNMI